MSSLVTREVSPSISVLTLGYHVSLRLSKWNYENVLILLIIRVDYVEADMAHAHTPYHVVKTLIENLLELEACRTASEKENTLMEHITDQKLREKMFLLNDLLGTHVSKMSWTFAWNSFSLP